jgi:hypothetical protein
MADQDPSQAPSFWHGLMAGLNSTANDLPTNGLFNMGMGLVQASAPFGNVGTSLMNANQQTLQNQAAKQNLGMNRLQMQKLQAMLPGMTAYYKGVGNLLNPQAPQGAPAPQMQAPPGIALPPDQAPQQAPGNSPQMPGMGIDPGTALNLGTLGSVFGAPGAEQLAKYPENYTKVQEALQTQRKMQLQPQLALLKSVNSSPDADVLVQNDQRLSSQYAQDAPKLGLPATPSAQNARTWAAYAHNNVAGVAGIPPIDMPNPVKQVNRGNGDVRDIDQLTGKDVGGSPAVATSKFVQNGQVVELPTAQGVAQKLQPYDASLYGASLITPQTLEKAYQGAKATGTMPTLAGRDPIAFAQESNYIAKRSAEEGITGLTMASKQQQYAAQGNVVKDYTDPGGKAGGTLIALNTAIRHLSALPPLVDAMKTGNLTGIRQAKVAYEKATGDPAPSNLQMLGGMASGEVSKAVIAGGGSVGERDELSDPFKNTQAPDVIKGAAKTAVGALASKTHALGHNWDNATQGNFGPFDQFLEAPTKQALAASEASTSKHPPAIQSLLDKYK